MYIVLYNRDNGSVCVICRLSGADVADVTGLLGAGRDNGNENGNYSLRV